MAALRALLALVLAATAGSLTGHASQVQIPKGSNVLAGRVVEIATEAPVAGAIVTLTIPSPDIRPGQRPPLRNVMTAADGSFVFRDLPAGKYTITTTAFGYHRDDYPPHAVELADSAKPTHLTLRVWKYGSISGRVFDEHGEPVVGVPVHALKRVTIGGAIVLRNEATAAETDDRGTYQIGNLPPGQYLAAALATSMSVPAALADSISAAPNARAAFDVTSTLLPGGAGRSVGDGLRLDDFVLQRLGPAPVLSPEGRVLTFSNTLHPGTHDLASATTIKLGSGEARTGVDIPLRFTPGVRVSGVLTGPAGPLPNIAIRLIPPSTSASNSYEPFGVAGAVTDANGRFVFLSVPPGHYVARASMVQIPSRDRPGISLSTDQPLTVPEAGVTDLQLRLNTGPVVRGRIEYRFAPGTEASADDRTVLNLRPVEATIWRTLPGTIEPDGTFEITTVAAGPHELYGGSTAGLRVIGVSRGGQAVDDYIVDVPQQGITGLVVTLSNAIQRLSGTVTSAPGTPDPDALVVVFPADTRRWREAIFQSRRVGHVRASSTGAFDMTFLAPGEYYVTAVSARYAMEWEDAGFLERLIPGATRITLRDGESRTVVLTTFTLKGR